MVTIVRYAALFSGTLCVAAAAALLCWRHQTPFPPSLMWVTAFAAPAGWLNWLLVTLFLQRAGWRVPLRTDRFAAQVFYPWILTVHLAVLQGILASVLTGLPRQYAPWPVFLAGCVPAALVHYWMNRKEVLVRGRRVRQQWEADLDLGWLRPDGDAGLSWGGLKIPTHTATLHFAVIGATGSGKSIEQQLLQQDVIPTITPGSDRRAMVYDAKGDQLSKLAGFAPGVPVLVLHPFDARGAAWDIAADCTTTAMALQIAAILIPDSDEGPNSYFTTAARHELSGVIIALMRAAAGVYTFRDVILICTNRDLMVRVLSLFAETRDRLEHLKEERTAQSVVSTLVTKLAEYAPIAAAWDHAAQKVSLKEWVEAGESVLVLGNDEEARTPLDAINRVLFRRAAELVLARPESADPKTWFFLDEVREAGRLDGLGSLLTKGRSKGAAVVLGFQDIEGLRAAYGDDRVVNELVGQCAHKFLLRFESPATADWAASVIGQSEWVEEKVTDGSSGRSVTYDRVKRDGVLASEFLSLPPTNPADGLSGIFLAPGAGAFRATIPGKTLAKTLKPADGSVPNFVPRPDWQQVMRPWCDADAIRLGMKPGGLPAPATPASLPAAEPGAKSRLQVVGRAEPQIG